MIKRAAVLFTGLLAAQAGFGQPAVFEDGTLHIFRGAVVDTGTVSYFKDIRLDLNEEGDFEVTDAQSLVLAEIHTAAVLTGPAHADVLIEGWLSSACKELELPAIIRPDEGENEFHIVVAENRLDNGEVCAQVVEPFTTTVELDLTGLSAGNYVVTVNGEVQAEFTLDEDREGAVITNEANFAAPASVTVDPDEGSP